MLSASVSIAIAQSTPTLSYLHDWNPRSGDSWVDQTLQDINLYAATYPEAYIDEITRYYDAPRGFVAGLILQERWAPGDVYYACAIARVLGRPCRFVADAWARDHAMGWNALMHELGIEKNSVEYVRLKQGFVASYAHWARPLVLDQYQQSADAAATSRSPQPPQPSSQPKNAASVVKKSK